MQINKIVKIFYKLNLSDNAIISCLSKKLKKKCLENDLIDNVWYRPNPIDEEKFYYRKNNNKDKIILLNINQFIPRKNQIFLIEVLKSLPSKYRLILAGPVTKKGNNKKRDQKYLNDIKKLILKYDLSERVDLIEKFVNPEEYFYKSDFYLMPSINEGLGTTFLESLACGIPVIANNSEVVFHEWIKDNINGKLITLNPSQWAQEIKNFNYRDHDQKLKFSKNIINLVGTRRFDTKKIKLLKSLIIYKKNKSILVNE